VTGGSDVGGVRWESLSVWSAVGAGCSDNGPPPEWVERGTAALP
jgi:hypothetical protein